MKLWIVYFDFDYEGSDVIGVFDTEAQANYVKDNVMFYDIRQSDRVFIKSVEINTLLGEDDQYTLPTKVA